MALTVTYGAVTGAEVWDGAARGLVTVPKNSAQPAFDNASLLQSMMRAKKAAGGGAILMPAGSTFVGSQVLTPNGVYLWNPNPKTAEVKARTDFPINTPVVRIGDYPLDADVVFQTGLWGVNVHANEITGGSCVYSGTPGGGMQEGCGLYHVGLFGAQTYGVQVEGCQNFEMHELESYQNVGTGSPAGLFIHGSSGAIRISKATISNQNHTVGAAIKSSGSYLGISDIHVEGFPIGLDLSGAGVVQNITGDPFVTDLVRIRGDSDGWSCQFLFSNGATNNLVDELQGVTIPGSENSGVVQSYVQKTMSIGQTMMYTGGSAAPTTGTWRRGTIIWNNAPTASGKVGQICVASGTPGTWKAFGAIDA